MASDIEALRKWSKLDLDTKNCLLTNVFCSNCFTTTVINYEIVSRKDGILIQVICKQCGREVARVVEEGWFSQGSE